MPLSKVPRNDAWVLTRRDELPADRPGALLGVTQQIPMAAAVLAVAAELMALAWLGNEPPERRRAN